MVVSDPDLCFAIQLGSPIVVETSSGSSPTSVTFVSLVRAEAVPDQTSKLRHHLLYHGVDMERRHSLRLERAQIVLVQFRISQKSDIMAGTPA